MLWVIDGLTGGKAVVSHTDKCPPGLAVKPGPVEQENAWSIVLVKVDGFAKTIT